MEGFTVEQLDNVSVTTPESPTGRGSKMWKIFRPRNLWILVTVVGLLFVGIVVLLSGSAFSDDLVTFSIEAPEEISAGQMVTYLVKIKNSNDSSLNDVELFFAYPKDSMPLINGEVKEVPNSTVDIGSLRSGEEQEYEFDTILVGERGNIKNAQAFLRFSPDSLRSEFRVEAQHNTTITSLAVPIDLTAPPNVIDGQSLQYIIDYRNTSNENFSELRLVVEYPDGFSVTKTRPNPDSSGPSIRGNEDIWDIPRLQQGEGDRITIDGNIVGIERENKLITVTLQRKTETPSGDTFVDFEKTEAISVVATPPLSIGVQANKSDTAILHLGESVNYALTFKNNSNVDMDGVVVSAQLEGDMFDFSSVKSSGFFNSANRTVSWDASSLPPLATFGARQTSTATFQVDIKPLFGSGVGTGTNDTLVGVTAFIETRDVPPVFGVGRLSATNSIVNRISTLPSFLSSARINDPFWGSSGVFPPKVDNKSSYTVTWSLTNPASEVTPARVQALLAPGVSWGAQTRSTGNLPTPEYNASNRMVTWDLGTLRGGTGDIYPVAETQFVISITPSVNQVGSTPALIGAPTFHGKDIFTNEEFNITQKAITTRQVVDGSGRDTVVP